MEQYSSFRHNLNIYSAVALSGTFTNADELGENPISLVYGALKQVISKHPSLAMTIHGENTDAHTFRWADGIDLKKIVVWKEGLTKEEELETISKLLSTCFEDIENVPPWRLLVCPSAKQLSVTFAFHHSIGDGTSGKIFLTNFCKALDTALPAEDTQMNILFETFPPSLESALRMPMGLFKLAKILAVHYGLLSPPKKNIWSRKLSPKTYLPGNGPLHTNITQHTIRTEDVQKLLLECKQRKVRLVALILAVAAVSVDQFIDPEYTTLTSSIPRNLRPLIDTVNESSMGVYVASVESSMDRSTLHKDNLGTVGTIWAASSAYSKDVDAALAEKNYNLNSGLLKHVNDMRKYFKERLSEPGKSSLEHSSLLLDSQPREGAWSLDNMWFYQCGNAIGTPFTLSSIAFKGGALNISCCWASELMDDALLDKIMTQFNENIRALVEGL